MTSDKEVLREMFSSQYKRYYMVELFKNEGFVRRRCEKCGRYFWTLTERKVCDDQPCSPYTFIGNSPIQRKFDRISAWKEIERFFVDNGHTSIKRYPVVSRWRPDLYFTIASIIDFQRVEGGKIVFQFPANPLIVPQVCLRFNDIPSVGVSGKHFTSFVMVGQHSIANRKGYWKDRCIELDFNLLVRSFGIKPEEITFKEDVWVGYGAFGYSLEYFVRGLELGNAVFTAFEGDASNYKPLRQKIIDMGAGLERFVWLSYGTPTAYDANFAYVLDKMQSASGIDVEKEFVKKAATYAGMINFDEFGSVEEQRRLVAKELGISYSELREKLAPYEAMCTIADHAQTLMFGISDGMLPSNSGGGYNLRVIFRRAQSMIRKYGFGFSIVDIINWHIDNLKDMFSELEEHREDIRKVLEEELNRYETYQKRGEKIVASLISSGKPLSIQEVMKLYESDGITPEQLWEAGVKMPDLGEFYKEIQAKHTVKKVEEKKEVLNIPKLPPTRLLFYEDEHLFDFDAKVLEVIDGKFVILDKTAFYPRGGGQEPDKGTIDGSKVVDVEKYGDLVLHKIEGRLPEKGKVVHCVVDSERRKRITSIHTATHILNGSSRQVIGPWIWQHSAFKEENYGRIDITHFTHLTKEQIKQIEELANSIVRSDLAVSTKFMQRKIAEEKYGFRLYQGGVVPSRKLRIVNIGDWDIEACGGTHTNRTGEVGLIKIIKVGRVQDGVERIEFVAGESALKYVQKLEDIIDFVSNTLNSPKENITKAIEANVLKLKQTESEKNLILNKLSSVLVEKIMQKAENLGNIRFYINKEDLPEDTSILIGERLVKMDPNFVFVSLASFENSIKIVAFTGSKAREAGFSSFNIVKEVSKQLAGSGGGNDYFAQGGGPNLKSLESLELMVREILRSQR